MKPWQWKSHLNSSGSVKKQMDSFVTFIHQSNHLQTHHLALQLCMPRIQLVSLADVHYRLEKLQMSVCLHSFHQMFGCEETHPCIATTHSLQCYINKFSSIPMLWKSNFGSKYIFGYGKPKHDKHIIHEFLYMATFGTASEWESATTLGQHTLSSNSTTLQPHDQRHSTYYTFRLTWRVNRRYRVYLVGHCFLIQMFM